MGPRLARLDAKGRFRDPRHSDVDHDRNLRLDRMVADAQGFELARGDRDLPGMFVRLDRCVRARAKAAL